MFAGRADGPPFFHRVIRGNRCRSAQTDITRRFEKDADAEGQLDKTVRLESVKQEDYDTVFYPGGQAPYGTWPKIRTRSNGFCGGTSTA